MANLKLHVVGMHCGNCQAKVERALKGVPGVYTAIVDLTAGEAEVDFDDDSVTTSRLLDAVRQAGYGVKLAG
jgi:copper chaperone CopZ